MGFALGAVAGTVLGLLHSGRHARLWAIGNPIIAATYPIPKIALLPLIILWLGIGETPKVIMIALGVFFPVVINAHAGVRGTDPLMVKAAKSLGAGPWQVVLKVIATSALPTILAGYRLGAGIALLLVVSGGDDQRHHRCRLPDPAFGRPDAHWEADGRSRHASLLGLASTWGLRALEAWLAPWREEGRG